MGALRRFGDCLYHAEYKNGDVIQMDRRGHMGEHGGPTGNLLCHVVIVDEMGNYQIDSNTILQERLITQIHLHHNLRMYCRKTES